RLCGPRRAAAEPQPVALRQALRNQLAGLLGDRFTTSLSVREQFGRGESYQQVHAPDAVAFPISTEEVSGVSGPCHADDIPTIASGTQTSLEGHIAAVRGG